MFLFCFLFFKQKTAYEMRISDWSSDVCSSDLRRCRHSVVAFFRHAQRITGLGKRTASEARAIRPRRRNRIRCIENAADHRHHVGPGRNQLPRIVRRDARSEEHTSELQSLMRISYAVFRLKKTNTTTTLKHI